RLGPRPVSIGQRTPLWAHSPTALAMKWTAIAMISSPTTRLMARSRIGRSRDGAHRNSPEALIEIPHP
ncbi:MAG TPA: hypothetical protein VEO00_09255, partial [Actinomycetota bacterium]|nr:hypothetical protein [Actinomycetota bacterium]